VSAIRFINGTTNELHVELLSGLTFVQTQIIDLIGETERGSSNS
jgi:hypothetical protein